MSTSLFSNAPAVISRWQDPGDTVTRRHHVKPARDEHRPRYKPIVAKAKHNPFRQPIGEQHELEFRHMNWSGQRATVRAVLLSCGTSTAAMDRFDNCGAECMVEWSESLQRYRLRASYCRNRHCRPCQKAKASLVAANLKNKLEAGAKQEGDRFRFITLTLRHSKEPLRDQIKNLYRHFELLRKTELWKDSQRGGSFQLEVSLNDRNEWHPHLHIIAEGDFLKQDKLANHWMKITGGSFKVDVRAIKTGKDAAAYVAKYICKGVADNVWNNTARAQEWVMATKGLRTCATFGTWRSFKLLTNDPATQATDWKPLALLSQICRQAEAGSLADLGMLAALAAALQYDPTRGYQKQPKPHG